MSYAVIFSSVRTAADPDGYAKAADRMLELARARPGFLGVDSVRDASGAGITVSYWDSLESIRAWKADAEHLQVQAQGRSTWYSSYTLRVARVERSDAFER